MISSPFCRTDWKSFLNYRQSQHLMFINIINLTRWNANRCYSLRTKYLNFEAFQILFYNNFIEFFLAQSFDHLASIMAIVSSGNFEFTSVAKCLHFVMSYMKQNKKRNQTLETEQYGLEVIFNEGFRLS